MSLPLFTDEAIYIRWSQIARQDAAWRFISLTDGKQPSFIWLVMNTMRVINDPLLAGRIVSVFTGFGTLTGVILLTLELFKKKLGGNIWNQIFGQLYLTKTLGYFAGLLFILFPFALVYDRMALYDSLLAFTMVWALYMEVLLVRYVRVDIALITGAVMGMAMLTKSSGFFAVYLLPFSILLFNFKQKVWKKKLFEWAACVIIAVSVSYVMYLVLRLSPFYYIIEEKNGIFIYKFFEWTKLDMGQLFVSNSSALINWLTIYVSFPILTLALMSFAIPQKRLEKLLLVIWFVAPLLALAVFGKTMYPRFIYFMTIPLLILSATTLYYLYQRVQSKLLFVTIFLVSIAFFIRADYFIIFDFTKAPIPGSDLNQYSNSWPAGGGIKEMVAFFDSESKKGKIYVATQGTFGSLPTYGMEIYLGENKNIEKRGIYPLPEQIPADLKEKSKKMPVYIVFNDSETSPSFWPITLIAKYQKGAGDRHLSIYQVNP